MKEQTLKINNVSGFSGTVSIQTDDEGTPLEQFWRRRLKDSLIDQCVEILKPQKPKKNKPEAVE